MVQASRLRIGAGGTPAPQPHPTESRSTVTADERHDETGGTMRILNKFTRMRRLRRRFTAFRTQPLEALEGRALLSAVPAARIIDDGDPGFATVGEWTPYGGQGYQADVTYSALGTGVDSATWTFAVEAGRAYRISATWSPQGNRATDAPYTLLDGGVPLTTVRINQELAPNDL